LAAGRGSRYGGPKQLESFGPHGEMLMDYTIADAVRAGFDKVVLVVSAEHRAECAAKLEKHAMRDRFQLAFTIQQEILGTADAARSAAPEVSGPFALLNSDDYYGGIEIFETAYNFLRSSDPAEKPSHYGMLAYPLGETIPAAGNVSRGICRVDESGTLLHLEETFELRYDADNRIIGKDRQGQEVFCAAEEVCSMQFWLLTSFFMSEVEKDFQAYLSRPRLPGRGGEFLLPTVIEEHRASGRARISVLPVAKSEWCGVTNPEDRQEVVTKLARFHAEGRYGILRH